MMGYYRYNWVRATTQKSIDKRFFAYPFEQIFKVVPCPVSTSHRIVIVKKPFNKHNAVLYARIHVDKAVKNYNKNTDYLTNTTVRNNQIGQIYFQRFWSLLELSSVLA